MSKHKSDSAETDPRTGRPYRSRLLGEMHQAITAFDRQGLVEPETMRRFDRDCLTPIEEMTPEDIRGLRQRAGVSQSVLAIHLNVSPKTVESWESGAKRPSGPTLKLLTLAKVKGLDYLR